MYYLFSSTVLEWNGALLYAKIKNKPKNILDIQKCWWYGGPPLEPVPDFTFAINEHAPKPDFYASGAIFHLISERMLSILDEYHVFFETFPVNVFGLNSGKPIDTQYRVFRLLDIADAIDRERSSFRQETKRGRLVENLIKPVLREDFILGRKMLVRIKGHNHLMIVHQDLRSRLENENITGCEFQPLENYNL